MVDFQVSKNEELGIYEGTLTVELPKMSVTRYKADRNDFKYEMRRAISEIVEEIIEKGIND
jgi:glycerol dehydrogenase-like iron-containing ADH family enzyme